MVVILLPIQQEKCVYCTPTSTICFKSCEFNEIDHFHQISSDAMSAALSIRYFLQRTGRSCCGLTRLTKLWGVALHQSLSTMSPRQIESQLKNNSTMQSSSSRFNFESMNPDELDNFFRAAEISNANISAHFNRLADCLNRISAVVLPSNVARAAYALRNSRLEDPGVTKMLEAVRLKLVACQGRFSEVQVCKCIAAVRNMGGDQPDVLQIIAIITSKIKDLDGQLQNRAFGTILYSLKNMRSEPAQVRELLAVVAESMENYEKPLDGQCIGNSLFGLRGMSSEVSFPFVCFDFVNWDLYLFIAHRGAKTSFGHRF